MSFITGSIKNIMADRDEAPSTPSSTLILILILILILNGIFNLSLRTTQGLLDSLFELMNVPLCAPDYSCVSKRASTVKVAYHKPPKGKVTDLVIDSTGLKVFGEGEWKVRKHGHDKRRIWRKLHLAVNPATHNIVAAEASWKMFMMPRCCRSCSIRYAEHLGPCMPMGI